MYHGQIVSTVVPPSVEPVHLDEAKLFIRASLTDPAEDALIASLVTSARQNAEAFLRRALVDQTLEVVADYFPARGPIWLLRPPLLKFLKFEYRGTDGVLVEWASSNYQVDYRSTPARVERAYAQSWPMIRGAEDINNIILTYRAGYEVPVSVDATTDKLVSAGHPFAAGDQVRFRVSGGEVGGVGGLNDTTLYYVVNPTANDFQLALTAAGVAVDITGTPSGQSFVARASRAMPVPIRQAILQAVAHGYENREEVVVGTITAQLPRASRALLWPYRVMGW